MKNGILMRNENGLAMPLALLVMSVVFILGTVLWHYSTVEISQVARTEKQMKAHYLARSGAIAMATWINDNYSEKKGLIKDKLLGTTSEPVAFGDGSFVVTVENDGDNPDLITVRSTGTVGGAADEAAITLNFSDGGLPGTDNVNILFPDSFDFYDGWLDGTGEDSAGPSWVSSNNGHIVEGNTLDTAYDDGAIKFPFGLQVAHQEGQQSFSFYSKYLLFENIPDSLSIKNGNTLNLYGDIIVFMGVVELEQSGSNYSELTLNVLNGEEIEGKKYGRVYFFDDIIRSHGNNHGIVVEKGAYYFRDGTILRSTPLVDPPLEEGPASYAGGSGSSGFIWGN